MNLFKKIAHWTYETFILAINSKDEHMSNLTWLQFFCSYPVAFGLMKLGTLLGIPGIVGTLQVIGAIYIVIAPIMWMFIAGEREEVARRRRVVKDPIGYPSLSVGGGKHGPSGNLGGGGRFL